MARLVRRSSLKKVLHSLAELKSAIVDLTDKQGGNMAQVFTDLEGLRNAINSATNSVAARIDRLAQGISNSMTDAEVATLKNGLQSEVDRLTALGADPQNPVPTT